DVVSASVGGKHFGVDFSVGIESVEAKGSGFFRAVRCFDVERTLEQRRRLLLCRLLLFSWLLLLLLLRVLRRLRRLILLGSALLVCLLSENRESEQNEYCQPGPHHIGKIAPSFS